MFKNKKAVGSILLVLSVLFLIIGFSIYSGTTLEHAHSEYDKWAAKKTEWQAAKFEARKAANERGLKTSEAVEIAQEQVDHCLYWMLEWQSDIKAHEAKATTCFVIGIICTVAGIVILFLGKKSKEEYYNNFGGQG